MHPIPTTIIGGPIRKWVIWQYNWKCALLGLSGLPEGFAHLWWHARLANSSFNHWQTAESGCSSSTVVEGRGSVGETCRKLLNVLSLVYRVGWCWFTVFNRHLVTSAVMKHFVGLDRHTLNVPIKPSSCWICIFFIFRFPSPSDCWFQTELWQKWRRAQQEILMEKKGTTWVSVMRLKWRH